MMSGKKIAVPFSISTLAGLVVATAILIIINASLLRIPDTPSTQSSPYAQKSFDQTGGPADTDYRAITERNLFRAKLQVEIPKPKSEKEIEEETLGALVKGMALKGVMLGVQKKDNYAVIDKGGQKGVWTYEIGDVVEKGLVLKEIHKDSIKLEKGDFAAVVKLFSPVYERIPGSQPPEATSSTRAPTRKAGQENVKLDLENSIRRQGSVTIVSKALAEQLKSSNNMVMSSIAVKAAADGLKVVTVDQGSIAQRMGIAPDDTLQEVNGHRLSSSEDMNKVYEALKNATSFDLRVLRRGKPETLRYEIR
jgi:type II secretory pathway component PulC